MLSGWISSRQNCVLRDSVQRGSCPFSVLCDKQLAGRIAKDGKIATRRTDDDKTSTTTTQINHVNADSNVSIMNGNVTQAPAHRLATTCAVGHPPCCCCCSGERPTSLISQPATAHRPTSDCCSAARRIIPQGCCHGDTRRQHSSR